MNNLLKSFIFSSLAALCLVTTHLSARQAPIDYVAAQEFLSQRISFNNARRFFTHWVREGNPISQATRLILSTCQIALLTSQPQAEEARAEEEE